MSDMKRNIEKEDDAWIKQHDESRRKREIEQQKKQEELEKLTEHETKKETADTLRFMSSRIAQGIYAGRTAGYRNIEPKEVAKIAMAVALEIEGQIILTLSGSEKVDSTSQCDT